MAMVRSLVLAVMLRGTGARAWRVAPVSFNPLSISSPVASYPDFAYIQPRANASPVVCFINSPKDLFEKIRVQSRG